MGLRAWFRRHVIESLVIEVPPEIYACELCSKCQCTESEYATCATRIHAEFLERKNALQDSKKSADPRFDVEAGMFDVVSLSKGLLPDIESRVRTRANDEAAADSSAQSGFRPALRDLQGTAVEQSGMIDLDKVNVGLPTQRSAKY